jgi:hypothetical protein
MISIVALCSCEGSAGPGVHVVGEGSGEKSALKLSLKKDMTYKFRRESSGECTVGKGSGQITTKDTNGVEMAFYVTDVDEGGTASVDVRYTWLSSRSEGPAGVVEFDSSYPPEKIHPAMAGLKVLVGKGFKISVGSDGGVLDVLGIDTMVDQIAAEVGKPPGDRRDLTRESMKESLKEEYGKKSMEARLKPIFVDYPTIPVGTGASWKATSPGLYPPCMIEAKYTLNARKDGVATIQVNAVIKPDKTMAVEGYTYDVSGHMNGIIEIEEATGLPVSAALMVEASGTRTGTIAGSAPSPYSLKGSVSVRKVE